jgi:hypothetical protein
MLKVPAVRRLALLASCAFPILYASAQTVAPAQQAAPAKDPANPQLTIRANGKTLQQVPAGSSTAPDAQQYVAREFGPGFKLSANQPVLLGDLDGDGREDAVFVVTGGNPLVGAGAFGYNVIDPYDGYWSFSDPALNSHLTQVDPGPHYLLLIAHDWQGEKARAKYVVMNLPFKQISLTPTTMGSGGLFKSREKKVVAAIATVEQDGQTGAMFWNGKTYKFVQLGSQDE